MKEAFANLTEALNFIDNWCSRCVHGTDEYHSCELHARAAYEDVPEFALGEQCLARCSKFKECLPHGSPQSSQEIANG